MAREAPEVVAGGIIGMKDFPKVGRTSILLPLAGCTQVRKKPLRSVQHAPPEPKVVGSTPAGCTSPQALSCSWRERSLTWRNNKSNTTMPPSLTPPPDDLSRDLALARPDKDESLPHIGVAGDTYTILVKGKGTAGRYCLIDMHVPPGGGPPPHRHDFEEMFTLLEGEIAFTFRDQILTVRAGETINIPANAPHQFRNSSDHPSRVLCLCSPAGMDEFFLEIGIPVATRTTPPPTLDKAAQAAMAAKAESLAPKYKTEFLRP
jgi:quercetin dioxygenase-like cupin family protein